MALWFKSHGMESGFFGYVTACIACSLMVYLIMPDTRYPIPLPHGKGLIPYSTKKDW
jgi:hypothetical protein